MPLVFHGVTAVAQGSRLQMTTSGVQAVRVNTRAKKPLRSRSKDGSITSLRAVIASSLFLVLLAATLLVGGHAAIDPLLQSVASARNPRGAADFVFSMPDGKFCRHMSFDNTTSQIIEGAVEPCPENIVKEHFRTSRGFAWGAAEH
jgi:hypothetical protein